MKSSLWPKGFKNLKGRWAQSNYGGVGALFVCLFAWCLLMQGFFCSPGCSIVLSILEFTLWLRLASAQRTSYVSLTPTGIKGVPNNYLTLWFNTLFWWSYVYLSCWRKKKVKHKRREHEFLNHSFRVLPPQLLVSVDSEPTARQKIGTVQRKSVYLMVATKESKDIKEL